MIGAIKGQITQIVNNAALIKTESGISFWIKLPSDLLRNLKSGDVIDVVTYLHISENDLSLYGFKNFEQYNWFKLLLTVDSVGPKTAYAIICFAPTDDIIKAIKNNDIEFFNNIPGIGKKTAARIILELGSRLKKEISLDFINLTAEDRLLIDALKQLGFTGSKINKVISQIPKDKSIEERLKFALKLLRDDR